MNKLLTIIIPSYNMERYLERGLTSLIVDDARMQLFEALVMNDGSKDRTSEIGHQFEAKYPDTFRVIDKENGHYGSCVNRGLKEAKGTFVKILDADDLFDTNVFTQYLDFLSSDEVRNKADMILSDWEEVDNDGNVVGNVMKYSSYTSPFKVSQITKLDNQNWFIHALTYRTQNLIDMGYKQTEGMAYTDHEWIFYPISMVKNAYRFYGVLYKYVIGREGQSVSYEEHAKSIGKQVGMVESMVQSYRSYMNKVEPESQGFFKDRINIVVDNIYHLYLFVLEKFNLDTEPLKRLDNLIKDKDSELYESTDNHTITIAKIKVRPIHAWRSKNKLSWQSVRTLYRLANKVNALLHRTYEQ